MSSNDEKEVSPYNCKSGDVSFSDSELEMNDFFPIN